MMELLKKWLDGSIIWKEEKLLRNQAKEDTFLSDALEGLDAFPEMNHTQNISALERRLQEKIDKKNKPVAYPFRAIAAALLLLVSVGVWWNIQSNLNQSTIAEKQLPPTPASPMIEEEASEILTKKSTPNKTSVVNIDKGIPLLKQEIPLNKELAVVQKELPTTSSSLNAQKVWSDNPVQEVIAERPSAPRIVMEAVSAEDSQDKESVQEASIIVMKETSSEVPLIEAEPMVEETADAITYTYEESIASSPAPAAMVEEPKLIAPPPSDEGVISLVAEPETNTSRAVKRKLSDTHKVVPVGGMEAFKEYIKINTVYPKEAKAKNIQGTVFLVFTLDTDGTIQDVEVTKSLHPAYDLEAIRLLKEGPKWTSPVNVGYCKIPFGLEN